MNPHEVHHLMARARDAVSVGRVFGEPYEKRGVTVIPAARIMGGGGGGLQDGADPHQAPGGRGLGGGFGIIGRPAGAFVIRGDTVRWVPAVDPAMVVVPLLMLVVGMLRARRHRRRRREWMRRAEAHRQAALAGEEESAQTPEGNAVDGSSR